MSPLCWHDLHLPPYLTSPPPAAASLKMVAATAGTAAPTLLLLGLSSLAAAQWDPSPLMEGRIIISIVTICNKKTKIDIQSLLRELHPA